MGNQKRRHLEIEKATQLKTKCNTSSRLGRSTNWEWDWSFSHREFLPKCYTYQFPEFLPQRQRDTELKYRWSASDIFLHKKDILSLRRKKEFPAKVYPFQIGYLHDWENYEQLTLPTHTTQSYEPSWAINHNEEIWRFQHRLDRAWNIVSRDLLGLAAFFGYSEWGTSH